jgi:putative DNA primase/helicase
MKVARAVLEGRYTTETRGRGLWWFRGTFWEWKGGKWVRRSMEEVKDGLWRWLEDVYVTVGGGDGAVIRRFAPEGKKVGNVLDALRSIVRMPYSKMPAWLGKQEESPDLETTVAFRDKLVSVTEGKVEVRERDERWFDVGLVDCEWNPGAECPRWMQALEEWSLGDEAWKELLRRWMGYCMMSSRKYARWMLKYGKIRGGKGVTDKVTEMLVGGEGAFLGRSLDDLTGRFSLKGLETARVVNVSEVNGLDGREGEKCAQVLKMILGQDKIFIDVKYEAGVEAEVDAAVQVSANEIPVLPNRGMGLSGKMLVLPFEVSFLNREEYGLVRKLGEELEGIAAWALEGARRLEEETDQGKKWPEPGRAAEVRRLYHLQNNFIDSFLEARFVRVKVEEGDSPGRGFVPSRIVQSEFRSWKRENKVTGEAFKIPENQLILRIVQDSTWEVWKYRKPNGGERGLKGLLVRREQEDEL